MRFGWSAAALRGRVAILFYIRKERGNTTCAPHNQHLITIRRLNNAFDNMARYVQSQGTIQTRRMMPFGQPAKRRTLLLQQLWSEACYTTAVPCSAERNRIQSKSSRSL